MNSSLSFSITINDENLLYNYYFNENKGKSSLEDIEKELIEKLEVSNKYLIFIFN